ncbi:uncharacterized protein si:ch1073-143l10.2 isoform X2 [Silurus meridionalis]|uniref:uncharacterized protein si:ch1073-143l10.2 isoform X2 n=1 Tax=Silurus meridionalis TaxID=175797 RepID=UPI001EEB2787|nr:uncharacterized protein si:ch1073-143l10.2 isoform X2 [Silurus meridionalis]
MEVWKSHVRAALIHRDCLQKDPFSGLFTKVSSLEEMLSLHMGVWEDLKRDRIQRLIFSCLVPGVQTQMEYYSAQMRIQTHRNSMCSSKRNSNSDKRVSRYRNEAVLLARGACCLKNDLCEYEYKLECQSKELAALKLEQRTLREELAIARQEKEELLERWLEEKKEEAERINKHNAALERWNSYAGRLNRRLNSGSRRHPRPATNNRVIQRDSTDQPSPKHN